MRFVLWFAVVCLTVLALLLLVNFDSSLQEAHVAHADEFGLHSDSDVHCDTIVVGAGVGGLYTAYRLAPFLQHKLCLVDERGQIGGKVLSLPAPLGGAGLMAPTCAEQLRHRDVPLRCLAQELGVQSYVRGESCLFYGSYGDETTQPDDETLDDGATYVVKGGPQQILLQMALRIRGNQSRVFLDEQIRGLERATDSRRQEYPWALRSSRRVYRATRVVLAMPPGSFRRNIRGKVSDAIAVQRPFVAVERAQPAGVLNLYFKQPFWRQLPFDFGYCVDRNVSISAKDSSFSIEFGPLLQFVATPDRNKMNLLRLYFERRYSLAPRRIFARGGLKALQTHYVAQIQSLPPFINSQIIPLAVQWHFEEFAYANLDLELNSTPESVARFAQNPLQNTLEDLCFASEGFAIRDRGWMGGAVRAAMNCLGENPDLSKCQNSRGESLNQSSSNSQCLLLNSETHLRDLATNDRFCRL